MANTGGPAARRYNQVMDDGETAEIAGSDNRSCKARNRPSARLFNLYAGSRSTRTIPGSRPAGGLWPSRWAFLPTCQTRAEPSRTLSDKAKGPVLRRGLLLYLAVREGFEPSIRCRIHTFQACSFSHSDTSPNFYFLKWLSEHAARASCRLRRWAASRSPHPILVCCLTCSASTAFVAPLRWNGA